MGGARCGPGVVLPFPADEGVPDTPRRKSIRSMSAGFLMNGMKICLPTLALMALGLSGCGSDGPELYNLQGEVTFDGAPVPYGRIRFEPDTTQGNSGGMGYATITDGRYDTAAEGNRGVVGGPHIVYFSGMESLPPEQPADDYVGPAVEQPPMLFNQYTQQHVLPEEEGATLNFELPAEAANTLQAAPAGRGGGFNEP